MFDTASDERKLVQVAARSRASSASSLSLKPPRTPRFAEATAVHSPIEMSKDHQNFSNRMMTNHYSPQPQVSDVGFGYIDDNSAMKNASYPSVPLDDGPKSPLKSALRVPGTPGRKLENPLSPTFREEQILEKEEEKTDKANAADLKAKIRVRIAKIVLRSVNFSCSLIVLSLIASTFVIFNATKTLPRRNNLPAWAPKTKMWPQITLLCIACVSLLLCLTVMWNHWKGKTKRAEKAQIYYSFFAMGFFLFSIIMWAVGAALIAGSKKNSDGQDLWGWSCKDGKRRQLFEDKVSYALVCRFQDWSLVCCIIEVVVEIITIVIYAIVFYRIRSKKKLRKSMDVRDKARSDLYLAQLRTQSAPNTPGFGGPLTPRFVSESKDPMSQAEEGASGVQFASQHFSSVSPKPFTLQAPPISRAAGYASSTRSNTPRLPSEGFMEAPFPTPTHVPAAPGEHVYEAVPIPGAYASPLTSPAPQQVTMSFGQAITAEHRIESPPTSPRLPSIMKRS